MNDIKQHQSRHMVRRVIHSVWDKLNSFEPVIRNLFTVCIDMGSFSPAHSEVSVSNGVSGEMFSTDITLGIYAHDRRCSHSLSAGFVAM